VAEYVAKKLMVDDRKTSSPTSSTSSVDTTTEAVPEG